MSAALERTADDADTDVLTRTRELIARRHVPAQPFHDLIEANRRDQVVHDYATFDELVGYCRLSANPVGRVVLAVLDAATPERIEWSDDVCTALQLIEHWQDVGEDARAGRVYLPADDRRTFGVGRDELAGDHASPALRALMRFEVARARALLDASGVALCAALTGRARLLVAGFVGWGSSPPSMRSSAPTATCSACAVDRGRPRRRAHTARVAVARHRVGAAPMIAVADAYAECSRITASQAKNFAYGIKLLDRPRRDAMSAIYALARRIDDIGDGDLPVDRKREALDLVRKQLGDLARRRRRRRAGGASPTPTPVTGCRSTSSNCSSRAASSTSTAWGSRRSPTSPAYCRRVAGSIGRLSLAVFGTDYPESAEPPRRGPRRGPAGHEHPARRRRRSHDGARLPPA